MLELLHVKNEHIAEYENALIHKIVHYVKMNYTKDITSKTLCDVFQCSRSHLSHSFNQVMKTDLRSYINNLRIQSAKTLLRDTKLEIAEISLSVGFFDPNYFTAIFKKHTNLTPSGYRKLVKNWSFFYLSQSRLTKKTISKDNIYIIRIIFIRTKQPIYGLDLVLFYFSTI